MDSPSQGRDTLLALQQIQFVGDAPPFRIVPILFGQGTAIPPEELMAAKVKWADKAGYRVLTADVPREFLPYNAVIRVDERGTEDQNLDYLARIGDAEAAEKESKGRRGRERLEQFGMRSGFQRAHPSSRRAS